MQLAFYSIGKKAYLLFSGRENDRGRARCQVFLLSFFCLT